MLVALAALLPPYTQDPVYHAFADTRAWGLIPNAADTLSNGAFIIAGLMGLVWLKQDRLHFSHPGMRTAVMTLIAGAIMIGLTSAYYHLQPTDARLVFDRFAMTIAFTGALSMLAYDRLSVPVARITYPLLLVLAPASVIIWATTTNLTPYYVVQFGGILLMLMVLAITPITPNGPNFAALLGCYFLAKVTELFDTSIYAASAHLIAGHTLKHLFAAAGIVLLLGAMRRARPT